MQARITLVILVILAVASAGFADKTYSQNQKASQLYKQGKYDEALKMYDDAILEDPKEPALKMNKGSTLYKLNQFDKAEESYAAVEGITDKKALSRLYYNQGNTLFREGQAMMQSGNQQAGEKFKSALESYIKSLDERPSDRDAKWNLQLTQAVLKELQKQQQKNKDNKSSDEKPPGPSENAKNVKAEADILVSERKYRDALLLMTNLLKTDQTAIAFTDYTKRLNDVVESQ